MPSLSIYKSQTFAFFFLLRVSSFETLPQKPFLVHLSVQQCWLFIKHLVYSSKCILRQRACVTPLWLHRAFLPRGMWHNIWILFPKRKLCQEGVSARATINVNLWCKPAKRCLLVQLRREVILNCWSIFYGAFPVLGRLSRALGRKSSGSWMRDGESAQSQEQEHLT